LFTFIYTPRNSGPSFELREAQSFLRVFPDKFS
jgi:hypothetical protein